MGTLKLKGKDLNKIGFHDEKAKSLAISIAGKYYKHMPKEDILSIFSDLLMEPENFRFHKNLAVLAEEFLEAPPVAEVKTIMQNKEIKDFSSFGNNEICKNTFKQMQKVMSLPISVYGALMPDAHLGYGLPIGGVLATRNEIIPYGVGMDIGCRMSLSIFDADERFMKKHNYKFKESLKENTHFGIGRDISFREEHEILERSEFREIALAKKLHGKAAVQLGSSGSGNHFVEFGIAELKADNSLGIKEGRYIALLSHSGSRGFGAEIAKYYTNLAMKQLKMPKGLQNLAWLEMDSDPGKEYWALMNLAGDYAKACHDVIHHKIRKDLKLNRIAVVENHHNFAWKEILHDGIEYIVHRKGATPASAGMPGIIPGSMTQPGYIVTGKGHSLSLNSASHGAGRKLSRGGARSSITKSEMNKYLAQEGLELIGGGVDESPFVYKDLEQVMYAQRELVKKEGIFEPKIVRMDKN